MGVAFRWPPAKIAAVSRRPLCVCLGFLPFPVGAWVLAGRILRKGEKGVTKDRRRHLLDLSCPEISKKDASRTGSFRPINGSLQT